MRNHFFWNNLKLHQHHCMKSVHIRSYSSPYFPTRRLDTYSVALRENTDQNNSDYGHFLRSTWRKQQWYCRIIRIIMLQLIVIISKLELDLTVKFLSPMFHLSVTVQTYRESKNSPEHDYHLSTSFLFQLNTVLRKVQF